MVKNLEKENFDTYYQIYSRNPYPFAAVDSIVFWALHGEMEALSKDEKVTQHFQNLIEDTNLDLDAYNILRTMLVYGDAYVRLIRNEKGDLVRLHHLDPENVEIECDDSNVTQFIVTFGDEIVSYSPMDVLHFRWKPQRDTPYGTSMLKGLEPIVERENRIMNDFLKAFEAQARGQTVDFNSERALKLLKTTPLIIARRTQVPIGLVNI